MMPVIGSVIAATSLVLAAGVTLHNDDKNEKNIVRAIVVADDGANQVHSQTIEITIENGKRTVIINGEEVDVEDLEMHDGKVLFHGEDGHEIEMHIPKFEGDFFKPFGGEDGFTFRFPGNDMEFHPPKVVLGVQLAKPHEALTYHLDIDADSSTMLAHVYEDLPAAQAGLHTYDVIIEIEGDHEASPDDVRAAISDKEAGDEIRFTVIQEGRAHRVVVELDEYDAAELGQIWVGGDESFGTFRFGPFEQGDFGFAPRGELRLLDPENRKVLRFWPKNGEWRNLFDDEDIKSFGRLEAFGDHNIDIEQFRDGIQGFRWRTGDWDNENEEGGDDVDDRITELKVQIQALQEMIEELEEASKKDRE